MIALLLKILTPYATEIVTFAVTSLGALCHRIIAKSKIRKKLKEKGMEKIDIKKIV